jgi:hypothetical protein
MARPHASIDGCRARPTARGVVSTWTPCDERLVPRRANEGYTAELPARARLVCQAYHRRPGRTTPRAPRASTRSLQMPAEQEHLPTSVRRRGVPVNDVPGSSKRARADKQEVVPHATGCCQAKPRTQIASRMSEEAVRVLRMASRREPCMMALSCLKGGSCRAGVGEPHGVDDAHPHIGPRSHRHRMALAFGSLARVIVQRPRLFQGRLPGQTGRARCAVASGTQSVCVPWRSCHFGRRREPFPPTQPCWLHPHSVCDPLRFRETSEVQAASQPVEDS